MAERDKVTTFVIEGGGSHTSAARYEDGHRIEVIHGPTSNPRSIPLDAASATLTTMLAELLDTVEGQVAVYVAHGAASTAIEAAFLGQRLASVFGTARLTRLVVANDLLPLAMFAPTRDTVVAAAGTGTGFIARSRDGRWARASGHEFVLTDEGGGFDLGQQALRAAIRHLDGRGSVTAMTGLLTERLGVTADSLLERLFALVHTDPAQIKATVAGFADLVFTAADSGDSEAARILRHSAWEIWLGTSATSRRLGISLDGSVLLLTGSLLTARPNLRDLVLTKVRAAAPAAEIVVTTSDLLEPVVRLDGDHLRREADAHPWLPYYSIDRSAT